MQAWDVAIARVQGVAANEAALLQPAKQSGQTSPTNRKVLKEAQEAERR